MSEAELKWLYEKARGMSSIVEIGSWKGRSTYALAAGCSGNVIAVDHFNGSPNENINGHGAHGEAYRRDIYKMFQQNLSEFKHVSVMRMNSIAASCFFGPRSVDMVFIDGCHQYEDFLADLAAWLPKARRIICGHDGTEEQIQRAIAECGLKNRIADNTLIWEATIL